MFHLHVATYSDAPQKESPNIFGSTAARVRTDTVHIWGLQRARLKRVLPLKGVSVRPS